MITHSTLGASSAKRWMNCPGSVGLLATLPPVPAGPFAAEGSAAHEMGENILLGGGAEIKDLSMFDPEKYNYEEMLFHVMIYVYYVQKCMSKPATKLHVEHKFHLDHIHPKMFGTCDACIDQAFGMLEVVDYKHGKGVAVEVEKNAQGMYYALGALRKLGIEVDKVKITIVQPRKEHPDGPIRSHIMPAAELRDWGENVLKPAAYATEAVDAPLCAGDHCKSAFCDARKARVDVKTGEIFYEGCPAYKDHILAGAQVDFALPIEEITLPNIKEMSPEDLAKALTIAPLLADWAKGLDSVAKGRLDAGKSVPGFKLVMKKANRKTKDVSEVEAELGKDFGDGIYKPKALIGVTDMQKLIGKDRMEDVCYRPASKVIVVPESDKRKAVAGNAAIEFNEPIE